MESSEGKKSAGGDILLLFFDWMFPVFGTKDMGDAIVRFPPVGDGGDWFSGTEITSSSFATPLLLELCFTLRSLNSAWCAKFDLFKRKSGRTLIDFSLHSSFQSRSFSVVEGCTPPPTKRSEAKRLAESVDYGDFGNDHVNQSLLVKGKYDAQFDGDTSVTLKETTLSDPLLTAAGQDTVSRLSQSALGKVLLERLESLKDAREEFEKDPTQPLEKHEHLCRCFKLLILSLHKECEKVVDLGNSNNQNFETMSSGGSNNNLYVERKAGTSSFWVLISYSSSYSIEM